MILTKDFCSRAHRNDLENCIPFMIAALLYILTDPSAFIAINLIRAAVIGRIVHTFVYAIVFLFYISYKKHILHAFHYSTILNRRVEFVFLCAILPPFI